MAYPPINWQTGDTVTAAKLNKMDRGWDVSTTTATIFSETATCSYASGDNYGYAELAYTTQLTADSLEITFDGTTYTCARQSAGDGRYAYGGTYDAENGTYDFSTIPFSIMSSDSGYNDLMDEAGGTHTISVAGPVTTTETDASFDMAVASAAADILPLKVEFGTTTWQQVYDAIQAGRMVFCIDGTRVEPVVFASTSAYTIICLTYISSSLTTCTYSTDDGTANGVIIEDYH